MSKLNEQTMCETFDIDNIEEAKDTVKELKETLHEVEENVDSESDEILRNNIARANRILDVLEDDIHSGENNPHLIKALADLIKSITDAAQALASLSFQDLDYEMEEQKLQLKKDEFELKKLVTEGSKNTSNNTINIFSTNDLVNKIKEIRMTEMLDENTIDISGENNE